MNCHTASQEARILAWLKAGRTLTPIAALKKFGTLRLSGRIFELRRHHDIRTTIVERRGKRVAEYRLAH